MKKFKLNPLPALLIVGVIHLLCASLSFAASTVTDNKSNAYSLSWRAGLAGVNSQSTDSSGKFVSFGMEAQMNYWLAPTFFVNLDPKIRFENGSFQSVDGSRKNETGIYISEAGAHWMFLKNSTLSAGALDQSTSHTSLLIGDQSFPAARLRMQVFSVGDFSTSLEAAQAIPTSASLSTNTEDNEKTPSFSSASVSFKYMPSTQYFWNTRVGGFSYDSLPSAVAYESSLRGNTVSSLTPNESSFVYKYEGFEGTSQVRTALARGWDAYAEVSYLKNTKALEKYNTAYSGTLGSEFYFVGRKSLDISATSFRIEPDAAVAYFNSYRLFNTNRVGYMLESYLNFKKYGFRVGVRYTEAELIYLSPVQSREKSLMLKLETFYANI